jgi:hypothetical protein
MNSSARTIPINFPTRGLFEGTAYADMPDGYTVDCLNVRGYDVATGRNRGCMRTGISKYNTATISGANPIREMVSVVKHDNQVAYAIPSPPTVLAWQKALPNNATGIALVSDDGGNIYVVGANVSAGALTTGVNYISKYNPAGTRLWTAAIALPSTTHILKFIKLDGIGGLYTGTAGSGSNGKVYRFELLPDDEGLSLQWQIDLTSLNGGLCPDIAVSNGTAYVLENIGGGNYYLHKYDEVYTANPTRVWSYTGTTADPTAVAIGPDGSAFVADPGVAAGDLGSIRKVGPNGTSIWIKAGKGTGGAVIVTTAGAIYTHGTSAAATLHVSKLTDGPTAPAYDWQVQTVESAFEGSATLAVDILETNPRIYQAIYAGSTTMLVRIQQTTATAAAVEWSYTGLAAEGFGVIVDPAHVNNNTQAEYCYIITDPLVTTNYALHKLTLLTITSADATPRVLTTLAVSNGEIRTFDNGSTVGASLGSLSTTARYVMATSAFNRALFVDGLNYKSYSALTGLVTAWEATSGGQIPPRGRLVCVWNGRAVVAGFEDQPHNWAMSESGDMDNWDFFPVNPTATQAVIGNNSQAGQCPDIIAALIPYSDDLFIFGGDHSIYRMTGDPAVDGRIDLVTDITGMAFGTAWCKDPMGNVYFVGQQGGFYRMYPGEQASELSVIPLSFRFSQLNVGTFKIQLAWNDVEKGVHVFLTPFTPATTTHYFWDARNNAWWPDQFGNTNFDPTAILVADGDAPGDRVLLLGCRDGFVRKWNFTSEDDDATAINSFVFLGPFQVDRGTEIKMTNYRAVLANGSDAATLTGYGQESADYNILPSAAFTVTLAAGRNNASWERARGRAVYLKLSSNATANRWVLEELTAEAWPAGRARNR